MTRVELAKEKGIEIEINHYCPSVLGSQFPESDIESSFFDDDVYNGMNWAIGCRGITCKECWNKDVTKE